MEKLKMHSTNKVEDHIQKIGQLFPNCLTERKNEKGEVEFAIDFDMLRQELSTVIVEGNEERYQFTWPDKKNSILLANAPIAKTLRPCPEESVDFDNTENLYIEGDNLDVLKLLQETYLGKVKMIYIDPPYNTGNDFVYEDDFAQDTDEYLANSGQYDEEGNRLVKNLDSNGRFHTDWLNMIYPRLKVAKDLLSDDGVILVSIGDRELKNAITIMNEIYGEFNQVCIFVWKSRAKPTNAGNARFRPQKVAEYILVYSKRNPEENLYNVIPSKVRTYPHQDANGRYRTTTILTSNRGTFRRETMRFMSNGFTPDEDFRWKAGKDTIDKLYETGHMSINEDGMPMEKKYEHEESDPLYPIYCYMDTDISGTAENGKSDLSALVGKRHGFDTVKPVQLMKYLIQTFTDKKDLIMDIFAGSATTAQAVLEQNIEDDGNRNYILIQYPEPCKEDSEAYQEGFKTICDIGTRRVKEFNKLQTKKSDLGYKYLRLDSTNMKDVYYNPAEYSTDLFDTLTDNIKEDRTPEDLLFQIMLELGVLLSSKIEESTIEGKKVFNVADGFLIACFDEDVNDATVKAIAQQKPYYAVFRDNSIASDSVATNFQQIFETYSADTIRKVL